MIMKKYILGFTGLLAILTGFSQDKGATYKMNSQGSKIRLYPQDTDTLQGYFLTYLADSTSGKTARMAVVICPGGGYSHVAMQHEGTDAAKWLNQQGIDAYVLRYRVNTPTVTHHFPDQLNDVKKVMKLIEKKNYQKTGIMGFSAGGHLAGTYLTEKNQKADFGILMYPVITTDSAYRHKGSFRALLGKDAGETPSEKYSVEKRVTKKTPPVYLVHTKDDKVVPWQNSDLMYAAISFQPLSALHIYEKGGHGFGMRTLNNETDQWKKSCEIWLENFTRK